MKVITINRNNIEIDEGYNGLLEYQKEQYVEILVSKLKLMCVKCINKISKDSTLIYHKNNEYRNGYREWRIANKIISKLKSIRECFKIIKKQEIIAIESDIKSDEESKNKNLKLVDAYFKEINIQINLLINYYINISSENQKYGIKPGIGGFPVVGIVEEKGRNESVLTIQRIKNEKERCIKELEFILDSTYDEINGRNEGVNHIFENMIDKERQLRWQCPTLYKGKEDFILDITKHIKNPKKLIKRDTQNARYEKINKKEFSTQILLCLKNNNNSENVRVILPNKNFELLNKLNQNDYVIEACMYIYGFDIAIGKSENLINLNKKLIELHKYDNDVVAILVKEGKNEINEILEILSCGYERLSDEDMKRKLLSTPNNEYQEFVKRRDKDFLDFVNGKNYRVIDGHFIQVLYPERDCTQNEIDEYISSTGMTKADFIEKFYKENSFNL